MKKLIAVLALFVGLSANASLIDIEVSDTNVAVGDTITVNLFATDFEFFDSFDFDFDFDTSVFNYDPSSLVSDLSAGLVLEVNQVADGMALSFFDFVAVDGDFLLASFELIAVGEGSTNFTFSDSFFFDSFVQSELDVDTGDRDSAEVTAAEVSAPATLGLFGLALMAIAGLRRKF